MKVFDISRTLSPETAVWPGDQAFTRGWNETIEGGSLVNLGWMQTSLHAGTHADAPFRYQPDGARMADVPLELFVGEALVVDVGEAGSIGPEHVASIEDLPPRVLFRSRHSRTPDAQWDPTFPHIEPPLAETLAARGVMLLGTDAPSVDPFGGDSIPAHHALGRSGIYILENLQLQDVEPGRYLLVAAPLKLAEMDGSPVRALLIRRD